MCASMRKANDIYHQVASCCPRNKRTMTSVYVVATSTNSGVYRVAHMYVLIDTLDKPQTSGCFEQHERDDFLRTRWSYLHYELHRPYISFAASIWTRRYLSARSGEFHVSCRVYRVHHPWRSEQASQVRLPPCLSFVVLWTCAVLCYLVPTPSFVRFL